MLRPQHNQGRETNAAGSTPAENRAAVMKQQGPQEARHQFLHCYHPGYQIWSGQTSNGGTTSPNLVLKAWIFLWEQLGLGLHRKPEEAGFRYQRRKAAEAAAAAGQRSWPGREADKSKASFFHLLSGLRWEEASVGRGFSGKCCNEKGL